MNPADVWPTTTFIPKDFKHLEPREEVKKVTWDTAPVQKKAPIAKPKE